MDEPEFYHTAPRPRGPRSGDVDPRPGEDPDRGGQKTYVGDPDGMKATEPKVDEANRIDPAKRRQPGADEHQAVRGNEPPAKGEGKGPGDPRLRGEERTAEKTRS